MKTSLELHSGRTAKVAILGVMSLFSLLGAINSTLAQPIYSTGFEPNEGFVADTTLVGQDGWIAPPPLSPDAAMVTSDRPRQGRQTVHVLGGDLESQDFINEATGGYYDAIGSYRRAVNHDTGNGQEVCISARVRVDGPATASGNNFFSAGIAGRAESIFEGQPSNASVGELAISSDGHAYAYSGNGNVPTFLGSKRVNLGEWHHLTIVADFVTQTSRFYLDGHLFATFAWEPSEEYTGVLLRGTMLAYAAPDSATNVRADYAAHYERFSIKTVPGLGVGRDEKAIK